MDISDVPTWCDDLPFETESASGFPLAEQLLEMAREGIRGETDGYFDPGLLVGGLYPDVYARAGEGSLWPPTGDIARKTNVSDLVE